MTVFKTLFKILNKNKGVIIMYTSIFLGIVLAITNANKPISTDSFKSTRLNVAYYNHSDSELAENLCKFIDENHNVRTDIDENIDAFRDEIYNREVDYIVIIPENFDETKQVETYKLPGSITSQFMKMSVENFITTASAYESLGISKDEVYKKTLETMNLGTSVTITDKSSETDYTPEHYYYSYLPYIFLCVICSTVSIVLISFNKAEVKSRTLCSGLSIGRRNLILTIGCMIFTFFIALFYIIVSLIMYKDAIFTTAGMLRILNAVIFSFVALAFAFLISALTSNQNVVSMYVNAFGLGSSFICGIFVPRQFLSDGVIAAGRFFPSYWYVNVEEAASNLKVAETSTIINGLLVQVLFAIAFISVGLVISSRKKK